MRLEHILPQGGSAFVGTCSEMEGCTPCHCSPGIHMSPKKAFNRVCPPPLGDISSRWDNSAATSDSLPPAILNFHPLHRGPCAVFQLHNRVYFLTLYNTACVSTLCRTECIQVPFLRDGVPKTALEAFRLGLNSCLTLVWFLIHQDLLITFTDEFTDKFTFT